MSLSLMNRINRNNKTGKETARIWTETPPCRLRYNRQHRSCCIRFVDGKEGCHSGNHSRRNRPHRAKALWRLFTRNF